MRRKKKVESYDGDGGSMSSSAAPSPVTAPDATAANTGGAAASSAPSLASRLQSASGSGHESSSAAAGNVGRWDAASGSQAGPASGTARYTAANAAEPVAAQEAAAAADTQGAQTSADQPVTWYDEGGNCWCDSPDGWRYWWDAAAQQWRQHSQLGSPAVAASAFVEPIAAAEDAAHVSKEQQDQRPSQATSQDEQPVPAAPEEQMVAAEVPVSQPVAATGAVGGPATSNAHVAGPAATQAAAAVSKPDLAGELEAAHADAPRPSAARSLGFAGTAGHAGDAARAAVEPTASGTGGLQGSGGPAPMADEAAPREELLAEPAGVRDAAPALGTAAEQPEPASAAAQRDAGATVCANAIDEAGAAGEAAAEPAATEGQAQQQGDPQTGQQAEQPVVPAEPVTWYDEGGNCWCDSPDGWRYWWDAVAQQWRQHSQLAALDADASAAAAAAHAPHEEAAVAPEQLSGGGVAAHDQQHPEQQLQLEQGRGATPLSEEQPATEQLAAAEPPAATVQAAAADDQPVEQAAVPELAPQADAPAEEQTSAVVGVALAGLPAATTPAASEQAIDAAAAQAASWAAAPPDEAQALAADESAQLAEPAWDVPELPAWNAAEAVLPPATTEPTDQDRPVRLAPAAADAALPAPSPGSVLDQPAPQARAEAGAGAAANDPEAAAVSDLGKLQAEAGAVVVGEARPAALKVEAEASPLAPPPVGGFYQQLQQGPAAAGPGSPPTQVSSPLSSPRQRLQARYVLPPAASPRATSAWAAHPPSAPAAFGAASAGPVEAPLAAVVAASGSEAERAEVRASGSKAAEAMAAPAVMPVNAAVAELAAGAAPAATIVVSAPEGQEAASPQGDRSFSPRAAEAATAVPAAGAAEPPGHDGPASSPVAAPKQPEMISYLLPAAEQAESVAAVPTGQPEPEQEAAPPPELTDSPVCRYTSATMPLFGDAPDNEDQPWLCTSPGQAAAPPAHTPPSSARPKHLSSGSGDVGSPLAQADSGAADSGSVSQGFGSVMMLASETSSRHGSWLPGQVAAMAAAAAASDESDDAQSAPAALPSATPAAAVEGAAEGSAETDAAEDAGWDLPAEPATTFHVVSKPLFGPDGDEAAAFSDPAAAPQEEPSPSSFFEQPDYDAPAASAAQPWAAAAEPAAAQQAASWERPQPGQWTEAAAPWEEAGPAAQAAAVPWEQPEGATAAAEAPAAAAAWEQAAAPWDSAEQQVAEAPAPPDEQQAAASWPHQAAPWEQPEPKPPGPTAAAPWEQPAAPWEQEGDQQQQHKPTQPQDQPQRAEHAPAQQLPRDGHSAAPGAPPWQPAAPADADAGSFFDELAAASSPAVASAATAWEQPSAAPFQTTGSSSFSEPPASQHPGTSLPAASAAPDSSAPWQAAQPAAQPWHASGTSQGQDSRPSAATAADSLPAELQGAPAQLPVPAANDALDLDSPELGAAPASGAYSFMQQQGPGAADDFDSALQEVWSPTAADEAAAAAQQVTAATAGDDSTGRPENEPWYDGAGVCWMDGTDGWRYWWDASAHCWQQHSQVVPDSAAAQEEPGQQAAAADEQAELADVRASVLSPILEGDTPAASPAMPSLLSADWAAQPSGPSAAARDWEDSFGMAAGAQPASAPPAPEPQQYAAPPSTAAANLLAAPALAAIEQPAQEAGAAAWSQTSWQSAQQVAPFAGQDSAAADDWQIVSEQEAWQAGAPQQPADQQQGPSQEQQQQQAQQQPWQPASWPEPEQAAAQPGWPHPPPQEEQQQPQPQPAVFQTFGGSQPVPGAAPLPAPSMFVPGQGPGRTASPASNTGAPAVFAAGQAASCALAGSYPGGPASYAGSSLPGALAAPPAYPSSGMAMSTSGYSLHGRPPSVFGKLLFGGRVLVAAPTGQLQLLAIAREPPLVLQPLPGAPTTSLAALLAQLESFPGPLGSGTSKDKVARFCAEQAEAAAAGASPDAQSRSTLWSVLQVMAQHQGRISSAPYSLHDPGQGGGKQASPAALPEAQLAAALLGSEGVGGAEAQHQLLLPAVASATPAAAAGAAAEVQSLLLQGRRSDAFRLALDSQLWPVALLLSRLLGEAASAAAAAAMAEQCIAEGSPLQSLLLLLGGASPERPLAAAAAAAPAAGGPSGPPYPAADSSWPQSGVFRPAASSPAGAASWRRHLAVIAANRTPGDEAAMLTLGRQLLAAGQLLPAHICFVLAGALLQPWDVVAGAAGSAGAEPSGPPLVLLGADVANPRRCSRLDCILPTEVFTWSRTVGNTALSGQYLPILPYKLLHAYALADLGLLQQASAYCAAMSTTLQALGTRVPPGLLVCRAMTAELASRVQQYAAGQKLSLGTSITTTLVSSVGKWLDRGLTAVLGGGETGEGGRHSRRASHSRNPSTSSVDTGKDAGQRVASSQGAHGRLGGTDGASSAQPEEPGRMGGIFHRVSSITSMLRPKSGTASPGPSNAPPTEPENTFYYDSELKMWRERGVEPQAPPEPLAPPPTASWQPMAATGLAAGGATPPLPPLPSGGMPAQRGAVGVSSRYALAGSYAVPAAESAGSALAPSLLPQAGRLTPGQPQLWQAGSHTQAAAAGSSGFAAPAYGRSASSAPAAHEAPPAVSSTAGPPASALQFAAGGAAPASSEALAAPPSGPPNGLRIQHTRALSTDSAGSGWQPGMHFAATPGTSTTPVPHQHAPQHFHAMPYSAGQAGGGYNNVQF